jgi:hypothetical protein
VAASLVLGRGLLERLDRLDDDLFLRTTKSATH